MRAAAFGVGGLQRAIGKARDLDKGLVLRAER